MGTKTLQVFTVAVAVALSARPALGETAAETFEEAAAHHRRGVELFGQGDHEAAIAEFTQAQALAPSRTNLWNLARCYEALGQLDEAIAQVEAYLSAPDLPEARRARALEYQQELQLARDASQEPPTEPPEAPQPEPAPSPPEAESPQPEPTELESPPQRQPEDEGAHALLGPWLTLGSGLALALVGGALDVVALVRANDHTQRDTITAYDEWQSGYEGLALAGDILLGVGAAAAIGGLVWLLLQRRDRQRGSDHDSSSQAWLSPSPGGVTLSACF